MTDTPQASAAIAARSGEGAPLARNHLGKAGFLLLLVAALPLIVQSSFGYHIAIMICINAIIVSGLGLIIRVDQLSLAHGAFTGIGAYASALTVMKLGFPFLLSLVVAIVVTGLAAMVLGRLVLGLRGVYFVLATFAFNELFRLIMLALPEISGGTNGLSNIPDAAIGPWVFETKESFYLFALVALFLTMGFIWMVLRSPIGRVLNAIGENVPLAQSTGINAQRFQILAFALGSAIAGFGGGLMASYIGFISPESFTFWFSVNAIIILIVGGRYAIIGPLLGALVMIPLPEILRSAGELEQIIYGASLIIILRFIPGGIADLPGRLLSLASRRK